MPNENTRARVREIVGEMSPSGKRDVAPADLLVEDLGYDSLAVIELSLQIESAFGLSSMSQGTVPDITTVQDVEDLVVRALATPIDAA
ncbi:acyl carrier protein [Actinacidiphila glaucinigra]|uniref:Acyl carrier protein n=1 Tax=Actinacidiphila glaucinigra TaxID=235986 RepID=A0A239LD86_9ACTN|nr:acyl carrier protein [Actinacidiphila glaucinigra]SNT27803.1 acyl carrier protein [Actinacidiphila glaucinigra]